MSRRGESAARFAGLERGWNRPNLTTQEPLDKQLMTSTHSAADLRGISLANVARWDGGPSKTSQIVSFFPIENRLSIDRVAGGEVVGNRRRKPQASLAAWLKAPRD